MCIRDSFMHSSHHIFDCDLSLSLDLFDSSQPKDYLQYSQYRYLEELSSTLIASADFESSLVKSEESRKELVESGRGKRRKTVTEESLVAERKKRMERNKVFAREHRQRQKQYIANLEKKVTVIDRIRYFTWRHS
eukprot:TRINITY_DN12808_c0_g2_i1.p2 TRINITY_DN12808_c0_g2~~TRINITY_DN12808_c0_g2_i1.p2  ORF type:complete len:135 (+),score=33.92 TRINITY_DN12808_c0_g2_i1:69-473(+)